MPALLRLAALLVTLPVTAFASTLNFSFTGNLVVTDPSGNVVYNDGAFYTPIAALLSYDTTSGIGSSNISITMPDFLGSPATFHDMTLTDLGGNQIEGNVLLDWGKDSGLGDDNMPLHILWDATGFFTALNFGLEVGDILSGSTLYRDGIAFGGNGNGEGDPGEEVIDPGTMTALDLMSATPYSDTFTGHPKPEGPAPLAAIAGTMGITGTGLAADGFKGYFNIGSGMSMHYLGNETAVPVPAAAWLFLSGLLGLAGTARRRQPA